VDSDQQTNEAHAAQSWKFSTKLNSIQTIQIQTTQIGIATELIKMLQLVVAQSAKCKLKLTFKYK